MPAHVTAVIFTTNWAGLEPLDEALPKGNYVLANAIAGGELSGNMLTAAWYGRTLVEAVRSFPSSKTYGLQRRARDRV
ncbi:MAG: hypothetical protein ABSF89_02170 [Acidimicrobiales bacterium]|jgi:hypothetical protein